MADDAHQAATPDDTSVTTLTVPERKPAPPRRKAKKLPPYKVLLHNDDVNTFDHVISAILKLTTLEAQEAMLRAIEAHETGVALLLVTHRERAELYQEQFATFNVTVTFEPDEA